jgi:phosphoribosylformylglycinamidine (FGAM) synthase PurS component
MKARIAVRLRPDVLDPQGKAIGQSTDAKAILSARP